MSGRRRLSDRADRAAVGDLGSHLYWAGSEPASAPLGLLLLATIRPGGRKVPDALMPAARA